MSVDCNFANTTANSDSTYGLVFGPELGGFLSRTQATCISFGTKLEALVTEGVRSAGNTICIDQYKDITNIDIFMGMLSDLEMSRGMYKQAFKLGKNVVWIKYRIFKNTEWAKRVLDGQTNEPDYLIFEFQDERCKIYVVEQKCGAAFDTGKLESMKLLSEIANLIEDGLRASDFVDVFPILLTSFRGG